MRPLSLGAAPLCGVARAALLTNSEVQRRGVLATTVTDSGDGFTGFYNITCCFKQSLIVAVKAQIAITVIKNYQQAGATQPIGKHHTPTVNGVDLGAGGGTDHHAIPLGAGVVATGFTKACKQSTINWPWKFASG